MSSAIPMIRLELQGMKHAITFAFGQHMEQQMVEVQAAVDRVCTPENIDRLIDSASREAIEFAIKSEVQAFYAYGGGRQAIRDAVNAALDERDETAKRRGKS